MARVLLILSAVLILVTAGLGYKTYQQVEELQGDLQTTARSLNQTKSTLAKTEDKLKTTEAELSTTKDTLEQARTDLTKAKTDLDDTVKKLADATAEVEAQTRKVTEMQEAMAKINPNAEGGDVGVQIEKMQAELAQARTELAEARQVQQTLQERATQLESDMGSKDRTIQEYKQGYVRQGLSGQVLAYNPGWNFVVVSIGDRAGLKPGVQMVVSRGGSMVARVRVTTVEPNTAIADVIPNSLARGQTIQQGDRVIYQGSR